MDQNFQTLRDKAIMRLSDYLDSLKDDKRGSVLAYWINDYVRFLEKEDDFVPSKTPHLKRGNIVKVHLGYRVGSEEGGLRYAIVIDISTNASDGTVRIIPLTSLKRKHDLSKLYFSNVYLGNEIYDELMAKFKDIYALSTTMLDGLRERLNMESELSQAEAEDIERSIEFLKNKLKVEQKTKSELLKMKQGSIALVGQITTVSKLRIYNPRHSTDALFDVRISDEALDKIDAKIKELYTKM